MHHPTPPTERCPFSWDLLRPCVPRLTLLAVSRSVDTDKETARWRKNKTRPRTINKERKRVDMKPMDRYGGDQPRNTGGFSDPLLAQGHGIPLLFQLTSKNRARTSPFVQNCRGDQERKREGMSTREPSSIITILTATVIARPPLPDLPCTSTGASSACKCCVGEIEVGRLLLAGEDVSRLGDDA